MIKISEITKIIQKRIENYQFKPQKKSDGRVISVSDGVALVQGLDDVKYLELITFSSNAKGIAFTLETDYVGVILLDKISQIKENDLCQRTNDILSIGVSEKFLGRVVDPLGNTLDGKGTIKFLQKETIEKIAPGIMERESVNEPLQTGIFAIDTLLPIGKGQRELIIGDRQTGKTTLAVDTIINQKNKGVYCVYVSIGQKTSDVLQIVNKLKIHKAMQNTIIVSASPSTTEAMRYLAPFSGMTYAEYFLNQGKDVLIVFDDLSKHAIAYRGLSLLLRRTPGRQAYPGDVFYLHSRLLERAVKLNKEHGGGSITALPIIETQLQDLTAYIPTNVISITDGQIFFLNEYFNLGIRPAINFGLSVSRVGSSAQFPMIKKMVGDLKFDLAKYRELEIFARFGGNLDKKTMQILHRGSIIIELLKQKEAFLLPQWMMCIYLLAINEHLIDDLKIGETISFKENLVMYFEKLKKDPIIQKMFKTKTFDPKTKKWFIDHLQKIIKKVKKTP